MLALPKICAPAFMKKGVSPILKRKPCSGIAGRPLSECRGTRKGGKHHQDDDHSVHVILLLCSSSMKPGNEPWTQRSNGQQNHRSGHEEKLDCELPRERNEKADGPDDKRRERDRRSPAGPGGEFPRGTGKMNSGRAGEREKLFGERDVGDVPQAVVDPHHRARVVTACAATSHVEDHLGEEGGGIPRIQPPVVKPPELDTIHGQFTGKLLSRPFPFSP